MATVMELTSFVPNPSGNNTFNLNGLETPAYIDFWIGPRNSTTETVNMHSFGAVDITNGNATWQSNYTDGTGSQTKNGVGGSTTSSCLQHYTRVSGTITKVVDIKFVSAASGQFVINVVTASSSYTVYARIYG